MERLAQSRHEVRRFQPGQSFLAFLARHGGDRLRRLQHAEQAAVAHAFEFKQHLGQIALHQLRFEAGFFRRLSDERLALPGLIQVERVQVKAFVVQQTQIDFEQVKAGVVLHATSSPFALFDSQRHAAGVLAYGNTPWLFSLAAGSVAGVAG